VPATLLPTPAQGPRPESGINGANAKTPLFEGSRPNDLAVVATVRRFGAMLKQWMRNSSTNIKSILAFFLLFIARKAARESG